MVIKPSFSLFNKCEKPKKIIKKEENNLQKSVVEILRYEKDIIIIYTDIMSGLKFCRDMDMRMAFINYHKSMGYKKGVTDLVLCYKSQVYFLELKAQKGKLEKEQEEFKENVIRLGFKHLLWRSIDDCLLWLKETKNGK